MTFQNILVPTDFGEASQHATDLALTMALRFDAKVTLLHVAALPPYYYSAYAEGLAFPVEEMETRARTMLQDAQAKVLKQYRKVETLLVASEQPWQQILDSAKTVGADLIVMGTHGRRGLSRVVLGSVAEKVVRHATLPVLIAPGTYSNVEV